MSKKKNMIKIIVIAIFLLSGSFLSLVTGAEPSDVSKTLAMDDYPYKGTLRVYVVEPESRWEMHDGNPYHFAFLDYAIVEDIELDYQEQYSLNTVWDPQSAGISNVEEDNVMVIAAVFNKNCNQKYAYPPRGNPFLAYYIDATTGAKPGESDSNFVNETYSHTILVEEGTATWCPYCPAMAHALYGVYNSGNYPFYFVALVADQSPLAEQRIRELNLAGYPSSYFDGGYSTVVGGYDSESTYSRKIERCGTRDVHELGMDLSVEWTNQDTLEIDISIVNNEDITENDAPDTPSVTGNATGKAGKNEIYTIQASDPEKNTVYYLIDWGDGSAQDWIGPYPSNEKIDVNHTWSEQGTYTIQVKAKDLYDQESDWGTLEVSMPKNKHITPMEWIQSIIIRLKTMFFNL